METIRVEILDPKVLPLLQNLADLNLIAIEERKPNSFSDVLQKLRSKADTAPSLEEITQEVETVRRKRYGR
jgi:hypothetical protein